ncbi:tRNA (adenine(37)-N6)-methyltransferase-like [Physella acuta]|uniref:tRNA (adenine(37)-N6)-methyltransferase-like n=1 Tax=Physella acuta TaxID=109671 RepID=UPI0027DE0678|nr:tRNA (adenine(37)-N6)-methyltransferase-like [Physella acuta]
MNGNFIMKPIGTMKSVFHYKNGTPRQSSLCQTARGILTIEKTIFNNPEHSLEGLEQFSHAWILFVFHKNNNAHTKAKVKPPRLDGQKVGVFSSRSPYRPNNIGLSLVKIDKIEGATVHFSGIDLLDGTPVLDIKPYIPDYDQPRTFSLDDPDPPSKTELVAENNENKSNLFPELKDTVILCQNNSNSGQLASAESRACQAQTACGTEELDTSVPSLHPVVEGFYSLSAALEKAGETLGQGAVNRSFDPPLKDSVCVNKSDQNDCLQQDVEIETDLENTQVDLLIDNIISKTLQDLTSILPSNCSVVSDQATHSISSRSNASIKSNEPNSKTNNKEPQLCRDSSSENLSSVTSHGPVGSNISPVVAPWLSKPPVKKLQVEFTAQARQQLDKFSQSSTDPLYKLDMLTGAEEATRSIAEILREEPRSVYRRHHCQDSLYFFTLDRMHVTCWFDDDVAQVVRVKPVSLVPKLKTN